MKAHHQLQEKLRLEVLATPAVQQLIATQFWESDEYADVAGRVSALWTDSTKMRSLGSVSYGAISLAPSPAAATFEEFGVSAWASC